MSGKPHETGACAFTFGLLGFLLLEALPDLTPKPPQAALRMEEAMHNTPHYDRRAVLTANMARQHAMGIGPREGAERKAAPVSEEAVERLAAQLGYPPEEVLRALAAANNNVETATSMLVMARLQGHEHTSPEPGPSSAS